MKILFFLVSLYFFFTKKLFQSLVNLTFFPNNRVHEFRIFNMTICGHESAVTIILIELPEIYTY
ncbi:hypothetical protein J5TS2_19900 [Brevibacillus halotolerans]|nr:hypothetical protein J5TS2_19900 [Brevibacillus halotolerans]